MFSEFCSISALSCSFEFVWVGGWYSQRLLSLNPTTVMVVLLLGLWLLLGCDNTDVSKEYCLNEDDLNNKVNVEVRNRSRNIKQFDS